MEVTWKFQVWSWRLDARHASGSKGPRDLAANSEIDARTTQWDMKEAGIFMNRWNPSKASAEPTISLTSVPR